MKKVLYVGDFSQLPTGYGQYARHLLPWLSKKYEVAELACYVSDGDPRIKDCGWKVFPNKPTNPRELELYNSNPSGEYGDYRFNSTLLNWKPDYVINISDPWAFEYVVRSPLRDYFSHILMPTVDAFPNMPDWLDYYAQADALLAYSEFGRDSILKQLPNRDIQIASPAVNKLFTPLKFEDKLELKEKFSLPKYNIIGTVMRNQPRKLYSDLFYAFSKADTDALLYCHTGFPDLGWNIPDLLMEHGITNRVLFSYKCKTCQSISIRFFSDSVCHCQNCGNFTNSIVGVSNGFNDDELSNVYRVMDGYIQCSKNEGFGIPLIEAAASGVMISAINYSAMASIIDNLDAIPIKVESYEKEASTGRNMARPDIKSLIFTIEFFGNQEREDLFDSGVQISSVCRSMYNWESVGLSWEKTIETAIPPKKKWDSPPEVLHPQPLCDMIGPMQQANFLIGSVLCKPQIIGGQLWRRLVKDLTYNSRVGSYGTFYFNEMSEKDSLKQLPFSYEDAYNEMCILREYYNVWEGHRISTL